MKHIASIVFVIIVLISTLSCSTKKEQTTHKRLIIFHAGSLSVPFKEISAEFKKENPNVEILLESAGSRICARKISDLKRPCDIMASADYTVINTLLIPEYADWNIKFASNEMTIVYHEGSKKADKINKDNWYKILLDREVSFGRSDPNADPCGYRAVLTIKLAEKFYEEKGLGESMQQKDVEYIRPKETDLLALLESNTIDYIFLYRSIAQQHGLKFLLLPDEINLKKPELTDYYSAATIEISGKKPGTTVTKKGAPMVYGITVPKNAPNRELAEKFVAFVLDKEKGLAIMEENGQPSTVPSPTNTYSRLPDMLKEFALPENG
jgi:molybdate/tungstate transport system substrate-binding protein